MEISSENLESVGQAPISENIGGVILRNNFNPLICYVDVPSSYYYVLLQENVIVPFDSTILRKLCELASSRRGESTKWSCKRKYNGYLFSRCTYYGISEKKKRRR